MAAQPRVRKRVKPLEALKDALRAYLEAAAPDFDLDALVHGRKRTLLRGESFPLHEVSEPQVANAR